MFDKLEKNNKKNKIKDKISEYRENKYLNLLPKNSLSNHFFDTQKKAGGKEKSAKPVKVGISEQFDKRMQSLYHHGRKRGKRYSVIGISVCIIISVIVMLIGYYFLSDIKELDRQLNDENRLLIETALDKDNICDGDACCLASLRRMKKKEYSEYDHVIGCIEGYEMKELECESSLRWCEPLTAEKTLAAPCVGEGEIYSTMPLSEEMLSPECCEGLIGKKSFDRPEDACSGEIDDGLICVSCGDAICGLGENECNCEEDCINSSLIEDIIDDISLSNNATSVVDEVGDSDNDGLSDEEEVLLGTNPDIFDTDSDGFGDGEEVEKGFNPLGEGMMID